VKIAFDTETYLIGPGQIPPKLVCGSFAEIDVAPVGHLLDSKDTVSLLGDLLSDDETSIVGANLAFDIFVSSRACPELLPLWIKKANEEKLHDVLLRQALIDISRDRFMHRYNLGDLSEMYLKINLDKTEDSWRLRYSELDGLPVSQYPAAAVKYAILDAECTARLYTRQERDNFSPYFPGQKPLKDEPNQVKASIWLTATSNNGLPVDASKVYLLAQEYEGRAIELQEILLEQKLLKRKVSRNMSVLKALPADSPLIPLSKKWKEEPPELIEAGVLRVEISKDTKATSKRLADSLRSQGMVPRRTDAFKASESGPYDCIALDREACSLSDDPVMKAYSEYSSIAKSLSNDIPMLQASANWGGRVHTHFTTLRATGRTASSAPNIQNFSRKGDTRACVVPEDGYGLIETDFKALELRTFAQIVIWMFGKEASKLAKVLNKPDGEDDVHSMSVSLLEGMPYAEVFKRKKEKEIDNKRTAMKGAIFGKLGGLGAETFIVYAKMNYGLTLTPETSKKLLWDIQQAWSEIKRYLDTVNTWAREGGKFDVVQPATHRLRAGCTYCSAANSPFQGLGADIAKRAGWYVWCETVTPGTVLYGARTVNMVHDSIMLEAPLDRVDECMKRQEELMCKAQAEFLPDVRPGVESKAMAFWQK
jgi:hypothetical protein